MGQRFDEDDLEGGAVVGVGVVQHQARLGAAPVVEHAQPHADAVADDQPCTKKPDTNPRQPCLPNPFRFTFDGVVGDAGAETAGAETGLVPAQHGRRLARPANVCQVVHVRHQLVTCH